MNAEDMQLILDEIEALLPEVNWTRDAKDQEPEAKMHDARFFTGEAGGWKLVITDFDITDQGFAPGSRGYDGAGNNLSKGIVIHFTRELAAKAIALARAATEH